MIYRIFIKTSSLHLLFTLLIFSSASGQSIDRPDISSYKTSYAIVVDDSTYIAAQNELLNYKKAVEQKGIGTYLIRDRWKNPEGIRTLLRQLYTKDKLEGAVLVGDIPVPMIRDAQHLTSTFKMDQRLNWQRSSVASDRFYDDFDLVFDFLKQDSVQTNLFYYSLSSDSPQSIDMDIYTARIKPTKDLEFHARIKQFLRKASAYTMPSEKIDQMLVYTGHGYHSESLNAWAGEQLALREHFPELFQPGGRIDFLNFRMENIMRFPYLNAIQRPGLDVAIFHGHGSTGSQLLNGYPYVSAPQPSIENIKRYLRSKIQEIADKKGDIDVAKQHYHNWLGVPINWMDDALADSVIVADSLLNAQTDLYISDLEKTNPQAKLLILDACDNGGFYKEDYLAAHYPFGNGENIVTLANSVGVLQDIWPNALIGNLTHGLRIGNWMKQNAYLESHLFGDPTFSFSSAGVENLNIAVRFPDDHTAFWETQLASEIPDIQALALKQLYHLKGSNLSHQLLTIFKNSPYMTVRLQALILLNHVDNEDYIEALKLAIRDPYELTRRLAIYMVGEKGSRTFIPDLIYSYLHDRHSERVWSRINNVLPFLPADDIQEEVDKQLTTATYLTNQEQLRTQLDNLISRSRQRIKEDYAAINTKELSAKEKTANLRILRAYRYHESIPYVLKLVSDQQEDLQVRLLGLEALSWYGKSYHKPAIIEVCHSILLNEADNAIGKQAKKTLAILN